MNTLPSLSSLSESQRLIGASRLHQLKLDASKVVNPYLSEMIVAAAQLSDQEHTQLMRDRVNANYPLQDDALHAYLLAPISPEIATLMAQQNPGQASAISLDRISLRERWNDDARYEQHHSLTGKSMKIMGLACVCLMVAAAGKHPFDILSKSSYVNMAIGGLAVLLMKKIKDTITDMNKADKRSEAIVKPLVLKNLAINSPLTTVGITHQAVKEGLSSLSPTHYPLLRRLSEGDLRACLSGTPAEREAILKRRPPQIMDELKILRQEQGGWFTAAWEAFVVLRNKDAFIERQVDAWSKSKEAVAYPDPSDFSRLSPELKKAVRAARPATLSAACQTANPRPATPPSVSPSAKSPSPHV